MYAPGPMLSRIHPTLVNTSSPPTLIGSDYYKYAQVMVSTVGLGVFDLIQNTGIVELSYTSISMWKQPLLQKLVFPSGLGSYGKADDKNIKHNEITLTTANRLRTPIVDKRVD